MTKQIPTSTAEVRITCNLTDGQAWRLAQFCKRVGFRDLRSLASSDAEAYDILMAIAEVQRALAQEGYAPH